MAIGSRSDASARWNACEWLTTTNRASIHVPKSSWTKAFESAVGLLSFQQALRSDCGWRDNGRRCRLDRCHIPSAAGRCARTLRSLAHYPCNSPIARVARHLQFARRPFRTLGNVPETIMQGSGIPMGRRNMARMAIGERGQAAFMVLPAKRIEVIYGWNSQDG